MKFCNDVVKMSGLNCVTKETAGTVVVGAVVAGSVITALKIGRGPSLIMVIPAQFSGTAYGLFGSTRYKPYLRLVGSYKYLFAVFCVVNW